MEIYVYIMLLALASGSSAPEEELSFSAGLSDNESTNVVVEEESVAVEAVAVATTSYEAEDQTPTGKFTTAAEVKMIVEMTEGQWIGVRNYDGQDLLYFTNLLSWRCGTHEIRYSVNGAAMKVLEAEPCHVGEPAPNALKMDAGLLPYLAFPENSIETIDVEILFDDMSEGGGSFERNAVVIN